MIKENFRICQKGNGRPKSSRNLYFLTQLSKQLLNFADLISNVELQLP